MPINHDARVFPQELHDNIINAVQNLCTSSLQYVSQLKDALADPPTLLAATKPQFAQFSRTLAATLSVLADSLLTVRVFYTLYLILFFNEVL